MPAAAAVAPARAPTAHKMSLTVAAPTNSREDRQELLHGHTTAHALYVAFFAPHRLQLFERLLALRTPILVKRHLPILLILRDSPTGYSIIC